jgi:hypothetical protein
MNQIFEKQKNINELSTQIIELEKKKAELTVPEHTEVTQRDINIAIFKSLNAGVDLETAGMELVYQLLKIVGVTGNKITEISITPSTAVAQSTQSQEKSGGMSGVVNSVVNSVMNNGGGEMGPKEGSANPSSPGNLNVSMVLDCTYISLQNLLQRVSTWNYLAEVKMLTLEPKNADPNDLTAKISINLYVSQ